MIVTCMNNNNCADNFVFINPIEKIVFMLVPGNSHDNFKKYLLTNKWQPLSKFDSQIISTSKKIIVLKDPYERWLEGFCNLVNTRNKNFNLPDSFIKLYKSEYQTESLELFFKYATTFEFDLYTQPQIKFLETCVSKNYNDENSTYFFINEKIGFDINKYLQKFKIFTLLNNSVCKLSQEILEDYKIIKDFLDSYPELRQRVITFLSPDYKFISSINFYNVEK